MIWGGSTASYFEYLSENNLNKFVLVANDERGDCEVDGYLVILTRARRKPAHI